MLTQTERKIHDERQSVYGPWKGNMTGTSWQLAGLQHQYQACQGSGCLPPWWAPLSLVAVKLNRIASGNYHADNFDDLRVYLGFVEEMQRGPTPQATSSTPTPSVHPQVAGAGAVERSRIERVYIAGPYSAPTGLEKACNVRAAAELATAVMLKGHDAHCPHTATHLPEQLAAGRISYERWMRLDFGLIFHWATAILVRAMSPGTKREIELAQKLGLKIYNSIDEIPDITN